MDTAMSYAGAIGAYLPTEVSPNMAAVLYLVAGVLFIYALRGLSHPETSRGGNRYGMIGMTIAVLTTLALLKQPSAMSWILILAGLGIGGVIGAITARKIPMTQMPELVAAFHSASLASPPCSSRLAHSTRPAPSAS